MDTYLTLDQIANKLQLSRRTLARYRAQGRLPAPDYAMGRRIRWRPETIQLWLETAKEAK